MKNNFVFSLFILILVVMFSVSSCFAAEKILFALVGPMTGDSAAEGLQMLEATKLAVKEINESGGVNGKEFEYIVGDDEANANQAAMVAQKFSSNKDILAILGPNNSSCAISALPTYEKAGIPMISPLTSNPTLTKLGHKNFVRIYINDDIQAVDMSKFCVIELGFKNVGILWENTDWGKGVRDIAAKTIPELGGKVLGDESFVTAVDKDYSSVITKFKGAGVDCVLLVGEYTASALFLMQSRNLGYNVQVVGGAGSSHPKLIEIAGKVSEGFYADCNFNPYDERPKAAKFIASYQAFSKFKDSPGEWGAYTYDVIYLLKKAIEMGGTTREKLIEVLHNPDFEFDGVTGFIKFDQYGDVLGKKPLFLKVESGKFVNYTLTKM